MSRTFRRTNEKPDWIYNEEVNDWRRRKTYPVGSPQHKAKINKYHSDRWGTGNAPREYRKELDRGKQAKNKQTVRRIMENINNPDFEPIFIIFKKDANWFWS